MDREQIGEEPIIRIAPRPEFSIPIQLKLKDLNSLLPETEICKKIKLSPEEGIVPTYPPCVRFDAPLFIKNMQDGKTRFGVVVEFATSRPSFQQLSGLAERKEFSFCGVAVVSQDGQLEDVIFEMAGGWSECLHFYSDEG